MVHDESHLISWYGMACRIPFRIGIFFIGMLMCVLLCEHGIVCALRWGVALLGFTLLTIAHPVMGPFFRCRLCTGG